MSFLHLENKVYVVFGVANRKSVAWAISRTLEEEGARVVYVVESEEKKARLARLLKERPVFICDFRDPVNIETVTREIGNTYPQIHGFVHSVAFADYSEGLKPFHETRRKQFLDATSISAFSVTEIANGLKPYLANDASVVAIGISSTLVTAASYGYMSPIKAALEGCIRYLAKSFSADTGVRFNTVNASPLKTSASAGIPGYLENYLFAEKMSLRKRNVETQEVANAAVFLLSPRASGINGQGIVVNAGMDYNYFDEEIVKLAMRPEKNH